MDGKSFAKLCRDCNLVDKHFSSTDTDLIFAKVLPKGQRRINLDQFHTALRLVAEKKGLDLDAIFASLDQSRGPVIRSTKAEAVRFHDDSSLYTGTHRYGGPDSGKKGEGSHLSLFLRDGKQGSASTPCASLVGTGDVQFHAAVSSGEVAEWKRCGDARSPCSPGQLGGTPTGAQDALLSVDLSHVDLTALEAAFRNYCQGFTHEVPTKGRADMDGKSFAKLCKDCRFVEDGLPAVEVDIIFAKVISTHRGQRRINFEQFQAALCFVAQKLEWPTDFICKIVADVGRPTLHQDCTQVESVRLHDDITTYTGRHKRTGSNNSATFMPILEVEDFSPVDRTPHDDESTCASTQCGSRPVSSKGYEPSSSSCLSSRAASPIPWRTDRGRSSSPGALTLPIDRSIMDARHKSVRTRLATTAPTTSGASRKPPPLGEVTLVLADVQDSVVLWEACPRGMRQAMRLYAKLVRDVITTWDGHEMATEGDSFLVAFHDSLDAVGFCLEVQLALVKEVAWPAELLSHPSAAESPDGSWKGLRVKMGVHTGEATMTKDEVTGRPTYGGSHGRIARAIEGAARGGQILVSSQCFSQVDGLLVKLDSPQVVDLGTHVLSCKSGRDDSVCSKATVEVHLMQLVPQELAFDYFSITPATCSGSHCPGLSKLPNGCKESAHVHVPGRIFMPIETVKRLQPGFHESPSGKKVTMCFAFTQGAKDLTSRVPELAAGVLRMLRSCVQSALDSSESGYECQEDDGAFMLAFNSVDDATKFAVDLQQQLPLLPWPRELRDHSPRFSSGLRVQVGIIEGTYTSRGPHTSTGRADYFGPIVNRAARVAAAAHPGQVLIGEAEDADSPAAGLTRTRLISTQVPVTTMRPSAPVFGDLSPCRDAANARTEAALRRLGAFALKGIEKPLGLWELQIPRSNGMVEAFPEPNTRGRVGN